MSEKLYKLGKWIFNHRWQSLSVWLVTFVVLAVAGATLSKPYDPNISIPGTEAQQTIDKLAAETPAASAGTSNIVFAVPDGKNIVDYRETISKVVSDIAKLEGVASATNPLETNLISQNGRIAIANLQLKDKPTEIPEALKDSIYNTVESRRTNDLHIEMSGSAVPVEEHPPLGEVVGVTIAAVVLFMTFGSLVAAGLPLLIAFFTVGLGLIGVMIATHFFNLSATTPTLALMLGLAVGIDYVLFMLVRYVKNLKEGLSPEEATGRTVATAGNAVIFAALTVVIALSALSVTGIPFLSAMGLAAAFTVFMAALTTITLLPALLGFAKFKVLKKTDRKRVTAHKISDEDRVSHKSVAYRWVAFLTKRPVAVVLVTVVSLGLIAVPATKMQLGLPDDGTAASQSTQRKAYDLTAEGFGAGFNAPLLVVTDLTSGMTASEQQNKLTSIATDLSKDGNIATAVPGGVSPSGKIGMLQVYPKTGPNDTATKDLIERIRSDDSLSVSGATAIAVDIDGKLAKALPIYLVVVVGLSLLVLLAVFRSILVPIKATAGFLLTIFATFGMIVMFFQWGWLGIIEAGPILSFLPILVTGILFGLAMDYQFFLVSGMHEEYVHDKDKKAKSAVIKGYAHGAKVVTVAAVIMTAVFAGFIFTDDNTIKSIGFALAVGVLIDAFIVRMTIVPAVMTLFDRKAWWMPNWLEKIIPNLVIEGDESVFQDSGKSKK